jgi:hypothetical protein
MITRLENRCLWVGAAVLAVVSCLECVTPQVNGEEPSTIDHTVPAQINDGWDTGHLGSVGLDPELIGKLISQIRNGTYKNIHSMLIVRNGKLVVEEYFSGQEEDGRRATSARSYLWLPMVAGNTSCRRSSTCDLRSSRAGRAVHPRFPGAENDCGIHRLERWEWFGRTTV